MSLRFYQIFYDVKQLDELYPFATPFYNETLTMHFENSCIAKLVPQCEQDFISVSSWALRRKRSGGASEVILKQKYGTIELTEQAILETDADVMILTPVKHTDILAKFYQWHGQAAKDAVAEFNKFIKFPEEVKHAIYENHFIARAEIYKQYVSECLIPAIEFIGEKEVFKLGSGYRAKKERMTRNQKEVEETLWKLGMQDWPIAPFILERLFSIWINSRNYKIVAR